MPVNRGSTSKLVAIKEVTAGTTPATPTMLELPLVSWTPRFSNSVIRSEQIRSHPYVDKLMRGRFMSEFGMEWEMQAATHDILFETMFGGTITTKSLAFADALKSLTLEAQVGGGSSLFDQMTYAHLTSLSITAAAGDTTPVRVTASGMSAAATIDAGATIASVVTPAGNPDPFTYIGASLTVGAVSTAVGSGTINIERAVDPLLVWGNANPREFVPGAVTVSGTLTIPYDANTQSTLFSSFTESALVFTFGNVNPTPTSFRRFTFPRAYFIDLGRPINDRGMRMQEIGFEVKYDQTSTTVGTMTTE